ncbi:MAG: nucleoside deaminase [Leptospiraceae bacterium]|nr:nucleoside deaminase [Leptospiraceae bacterium]MCP5497635.1 nucleoside deaminase [Leptospiraceae bacterium]
MSLKVPNGNPEIQSLKSRLDKVIVSSTNSEDAYIKQTVKLAIESASNLNYGVGAILVDKGGDVVSRGQNQVFYPYFQSGLHAEMDALNQFEEKIRGERVDLKDYTIYTSLEPCPMCMSRILMAGVGFTVYAADDDLGGMVHIIEAYLKSKKELKKQGFDNIGVLPDVWEQFYIKQSFRKADCDLELQKLAIEAFLLNIQQIRSKRK